ncbi:recombinase-like helix-turn-helix domain-containing protein [Streptomyces sp. NPDC055078]
MELRNVAVQSRSRETTSYEHALADVLEGIYGQGIHDLPGIVRELNTSGVRPAHGEDWDERSFRDELARLGEKETNGRV